MTAAWPDVASVIGLTVRQALPELAGQGFYELLDSVCQSGTTFNGAIGRTARELAPDLNRFWYDT